MSVKGKFRSRAGFAVFCMGLLLLSGVLPGAVRADDVTGGLVARWDFNGNIRDVTGNGHDGTWAGKENAPEDSFVEGVPGSGGRALRFDSDEFIRHEAIDFGIGDSHTFSVWHHLPEDAPLRWNVILGSIFIHGGFWFYHRDGELAHYNDHYEGTTYINWSRLKMGREIPLGEWFHLAVVTSPGDAGANEVNYRVYINGALRREFKGRLSPRPAEKKFRYLCIGGTTWQGGKFNFTGTMDDLRIYNRALSAEEVGKLHELWR